MASTAHSHLDPRTPVLVGTGVAQHRDRDPAAAPEAVALMADALRAAAADADCPGLIPAIERIAVPKGTWSYRDPARLVATMVGAARARTVLVELGIPQQTLVNDALLAVQRGDLEVAAIVGGESMARDAGARRAGISVPVTDDHDAEPDEHQTPAAEIVAKAELEVGAVVPVQQYAMIENALRAAEGIGIDAHLDEIAQLWTRFDAMAVHNPHAAFADGRSAEFLRTPSAANRPLAFPYNKWHATQWTVDQAAALIVCSVDAARRLGIPADRWLFPHVALDSSYTLTLSARAHPHRWPAMGVLGRAAFAHLRRPIDSIEHVELYSCFPAAVRVQMRELGLPADATPTITGGMPFAGGPLNNFVYQAMAAMAGRLRDRPGEFGLISTVSGLLTKPGLAVWSTEPPSGGALIDDLDAAAAGETAAVESITGHSGPATVTTYTVLYDGLEPARTVVIADAGDGRRCMAVSDERALAAEATTHDLIGTPIRVEGTAFTR